MAIEKKNAWEKYPQGPEREKLFAFAEDYRRFISGCKTERECVTSFVEKAEKAGFVNLEKARLQFMLTPQDTALWTLMSSSRQERA